LTTTVTAGARRAPVGPVALAVVAFFAMTLLVAAPTGAAPAPEKTPGWFVSSARSALLRIEAAHCVPLQHLNALQVIPDGAIAFDRAGHDLALIVGVCVDRRGPYPFILDTGAEYSTITTGLARKLGLHLAPTPAVAEIGGCTPRSYTAKVRHWSLGQNVLAPETLTVLPIASIGGVRFAGLLGSDVLSRFGSVGLDFADKTLVIDGAEQRVGAQPTEVDGPGPVATPNLLGEPGPSYSVGLDVFRLGSRVRDFLWLDVGSAPHIVVLDTGSVMTGLADPTITAAHLKPTGRAFYGVSLTCRVVQREYRVSNWSLTGSGVALPSETVHSINLGSNEDVGLLGMDVLSRFGWIVVDYRNGRLTFG